MLFSILIAVLLGGLVTWLIEKAPFISADYKPTAKFIVLLAVIFYSLGLVFGGSPSYYIPNPFAGRR